MLLTALQAAIARLFMCSSLPVMMRECLGVQHGVSWADRLYAAAGRSPGTWSQRKVVLWPSCRDCVITCALPPSRPPVKSPPGQISAGQRSGGGSVTARQWSGLVRQGWRRCRVIASSQTYLQRISVSALKRSGANSRVP